MTKRRKTVPAGRATERATSTRAEFARRVTEVAGWLTKGYSRADCLQKSAERWGVRERQADEYRARALDLLRAETEQDRSAFITEQVAIRRRLVKLSAEQAEKGGMVGVQANAVAIKGLDGLAKLLGLYPAPNARPVPDLTPDEVVAAILVATRPTV